MYLKNLIIKSVCCFDFIDHLNNGVVTFSGTYKDTGEPVHITHIKLNNNLPKPKCTLKCRSGKKDECLSLKSSDITDAIKEQINFLSHLKHENLLGYKSVIQIQNRFIYLIQEVDGKSTSAKSVSGTTKWRYEAIGKAIASTVKALQFLHQHNIVHGNLKASSILVNEQNVWKISDYYLVAYIRYLSQKNNTSCFIQEKRADLKSIGQLIESFDMESEALNDFAKLCKTSRDIESIIKDPLFAKISKFSRLEAEFEIHEYLREGAFGDVLKVKKYIEHKDYAIKRVKLPSRATREFKNARKEVQALSILKHKNIVEYNTSWTESVEESVFNSYKPFNGNYMDVE